MRDTVRLHAYISGLVQGVSFRYYTIREAQGLGVVGWVRNRHDGSVEVVAEGDRSTIEDLLSWLHSGPSWARVTGVDVRWEQPTGEFSRFEVRF